jgi:hypothetical protein
MFSQSVLSVYTSDPEPLHLSRWGETETNDATRNDGHLQQENNETGEQDANQDEDPSTYPDTESSSSTEQTQRLNEEATLAMEKTERGINQQGETMQEDNSTKTLEGAEPSHDDIVGSSSSSARDDRHLQEGLETNKDVVTKQESEKQESSSNPTWGQSREPTKEQLEEDWQVWEHVNIHETSIVYRHGRCHDCDKPVSSTNLDPGRMLVCWECKTNIIEEETKENTNEKRGFEKAARDDEEEWKRIPLPTSDDSSEDSWLEESSRSEADNESAEQITIAEEPTAETKKNVRNNYMSAIKRDNGNHESIALAFLLGPRRDGVILTKEGTLISTGEVHNNKEPLRPIGEQTSALEPTDHGNQVWTCQLLLCQLTHLKMGYYRRTQKRAKLLRQMRQHVIKVQRQPTAATLEKGDIQHEVINTPHQRLTQVPVSIQKERLPSTLGQVFPQCMNAIRSPNQPKINKRVQVTLKTRTTVKRTRKFSPIKIPGIPPEQTGEAEETDSELEDLNLFFNISNRFRPEMGKSNAESAARHAEIEEEYQRLRKQRSKKKTQPTNKQKKDHALSPFKPIKGKVKFEVADKQEPIIEPIEAHTNNVQEVQANSDHYTNPCWWYQRHTNNVQEVQMDPDHYLYDNPDKPPAPHVLDLIYDTGASISMMPAEYSYAWKNLRDCLHTLTGCFAGQEESNLQIGEFHGIITLDSGETRRVIIPECVQTPKGVSNTNLLADTAFLMAGHKYISHLS